MSYTFWGIVIFFISMTIIYFLCFFERNKKDIENNELEGILDLLKKNLIMGGMINENKLVKKIGAREATDEDIEIFNET